MANWVLMLAVKGKEMTLNAIDSCLGQDIGEVEVLLVMNGPIPGLLEKVRAEYPAVTVALGDGGVAEGWNFGLEWLFAYADRLLVTNNDVILRKDLYRLLVEDGGEFVSGVGVHEIEKLERPANPGSKMPHPDFGCFLIRKSCWVKVGRFDERFRGAYCEDCDYHVRMHRAGVRAIRIDVPYYHILNGTLKESSAEEGVTITNNAHRNRELFKELYGCLPGTAEYGELFTS